MGAFNTIQTEVACPSCGQSAEFEIQFKYGNTWQLSYNLGDRLQWGGNDVGVPGKKKVEVESIGGPCPHCSVDCVEFDVTIENDVITSVTALGADRENYSEEGYSIIEE